MEKLGKLAKKREHKQSKSKAFAEDCPRSGAEIAAQKIICSKKKRNP
jgi:hypothetical protein